MLNKRYAAKEELKDELFGRFLLFSFLVGFSCFWGFMKPFLLLFSCCFWVFYEKTEATSVKQGSREVPTNHFAPESL